MAGFVPGRALVASTLLVVGAATGLLSLVLDPSRDSGTRSPRSVRAAVTAASKAPVFQPSSLVLQPSRAPKVDPASPVAGPKKLEVATAAAPRTSDGATGLTASPAKHSFATTPGASSEPSGVASVGSGDARTAKAEAAQAARRARLLAAVKEDLQDKNPRHRIEALRSARDHDLPEVMADVKHLAFEDPDPATRRFAAQALALDEHPENHRDAFVVLLGSQDWAVRANASFGLARMGDEAAQQDLLTLMQTLQSQSSPQAEGIARAVASAELRSPAIVRYFESRVLDQNLSQEERARAAQAYVSEYSAVSTGTPTAR